VSELPSTSLAIENAIADCISVPYGATRNSIMSFDVTNTRRLSSSSMTRSSASTSPSGNIKVIYKIVITNTDYSAEEIVYTMKLKVADGSFNKFIQQFGVSALAAANSNQTDLTIVILSESPSVRTTVSPSKIPQVVPTQTPSEYFTASPSIPSTTPSMIPLLVSTAPVIPKPSTNPSVSPSFGPVNQPSPFPTNSVAGTVAFQGTQVIHISYYLINYFTLTILLYT
jgi:hypothetical protein